MDETRKELEEVCDQHSCVNCPKGHLCREHFATITNRGQAWHYLRTYHSLARMGHVGRFLSPAYKVFKKDRREGEDIFAWCVRKALQELGDPLASLFCPGCNWYEWDVDQVQTSQPDGSVTSVSFLICPICNTKVEL